MYKLTQQVNACKVTPQQCESFLTLNNFPGQRDMHEAKAKRYCDLLIQGRLRPVEIAFATCPDGNRYLMNGQHVCQGCVWSGREMNAIITYYKCEDWRDAWQLFATFDVHSTRTQNQIFHAARGQFINKALRDIPFRVLGSCGTALAALNNGKVNFKKGQGIADKTTKPLLVDNNPKDVQWVSTFVDAKHMLKVGCVAAMIATHRKHPSEADVFWRKVQTGENIASRKRPEMKVRDYLLRSTHRTLNSKNTHEVNYAYIIAWWNAYISGEERTSVKIAAMKTLPEVL